MDEVVSKIISSLTIQKEIKLKEETYKCFSLEKRENASPVNNIKARFARVNSVLKYFREILPGELNQYVSELKNKFDDSIGEYKFDKNAFDWTQLRENLDILPNYPNLEESIYYFVCKTINLPQDYSFEKGEVELSFYDRIKAGETVSYFLVRTLADIYGEQEGTKIYKQIVPRMLQERRENEKEEKPEDPKEVTILDSNKSSIETWCRIGLADFSFCIFDDYKIIYRFDNCLTPEVLKEFNDPDIAYLATCYMADAPEFNEGKTIHLRRTQTLHHAKFCDELYWNNYVHPDTEQPSLEFIEQIGKSSAE